MEGKFEVRRPGERGPRSEKSPELARLHRFLLHATEAPEHCICAVDRKRFLVDAAVITRRQRRFECLCCYRAVCFLCGGVIDTELEPEAFVRVAEWSDRSQDVTEEQPFNDSLERIL